MKTQTQEDPEENALKVVDALRQVDTLGSHHHYKTLLDALADLITQIRPETAEGESPMDTQTESKTSHQLTQPENAGRGLTEWIATCNCGARYRRYYSRHGLETVPYNEKARSGTCPHKTE